MTILSDKKLDEALAKLPREIEPARDLWPGIAARIPRHHTRNWRHAVMNVAAAAAVIAVAVIIARIALPTSAPSPGVQPSAAATEPGIAGTAVATVGPRALFMMQLASDSDLPQKARGVFLDNLRMIHEDILRTHAAVKKYPGDINLRGLLFNLYQQQARLLNEAQRAQIQTTTRITV